MMKNWMYQFIDTLTSELRSSGFATVTFGDAAEIDLNKQNTFPIAHMVLPDAVMNNKITTFSMDLIVIDLADFQKEYTNTLNQNFNVSNVQDILQDLIARVQRSLLWVDNNNFIELQYPVQFNSFKENFTNAVAGWTVTINFTTPSMADLCENNLD